VVDTPSVAIGVSESTQTLRKPLLPARNGLREMTSIDTYSDCDQRGDVRLFKRTGQKVQFSDEWYRSGPEYPEAIRIAGNSELSAGGGARNR